MTDSEAKDPEGGNGAAPDEAGTEAAGAVPEAAAAPVDPVAEAKAESARLRDQLLRTAADFDNFRKRTRKELVDAEQRGRDELLRDLLPVFDNLERAVQHMEGASDVQAVADGIRMVLRQFLDTLTKMSIVRVPSVGAAFDPAVHEAIQHLESKEPPGTVVAEVQAGYKTGERLVRPALVVVAKAPQPPAPAPDPDPAPEPEPEATSGSGDAES